MRSRRLGPKTAVVGCRGRTFPCGTFQFGGGRTRPLGESYVKLIHCQGFGLIQINAAAERVRAFYVDEPPECSLGRYSRHRHYVFTVIGLLRILMRKLSILCEDSDVLIA